MTIKLIEGNDRVREKKCAQKNEEILKKFDCYMIPEFLFSGDLTVPRIKILSKKDDKIQQKACLEELTKNWGQFDCVMIPEFLLTGAELRSRIKIQAKPREKK